MKGLAAALLLIAGVSAYANVTPKKLVYAQSTEAVTLNPHDANDLYSRRVISNIFDRLIERNENLEIVPGLAERWEHKDENTTVFYLKKGVKFHNGQELTSADVKYTLENAKKSPKVGTLFEVIEEVQTPDPYTAIVKTSEPSGALIYHLGHVAASIMSKDYNENEKEFHLKPNGTGAFAFVDWKPGDRVVLKKNEQYFKGPAAIDIVEVRGVPEENSRVIGLETGEFHIATDIEGIGRNTVIDNKNIELAEKSSMGVAYMGMNTQNGPLADLRVRKAIAMGIDRDSIIDFLLMGSVEKANSLLGPGVFGYSKDTKTYDYNQEQAKALLKEAGHETLNLRLATSNNELRKQMSEIMQAQLKEIGVNLSIEVLEWSTFLNQTGKGDSDLFMLGWSNSSGDADYGLSSMIHSSMKGASGNRSFYESKVVDDLLAAGKRELDPVKRAALYAKAQDQMNADIPLLPIYFMLANAGVRKEVKGFVQTPINTPNFYKLSF